MHDRDLAIQKIRQALKKRSGKTWSVTGGRGTAWGWIRIQAPPARRVDHNTTPAECAQLGKLLGLDGPIHFQGCSIPSGGAYREEYVARAEGRLLTYLDGGGKLGTPYWD